MTRCYVRLWPDSAILSNGGDRLLTHLKRSASWRTPATTDGQGRRLDSTSYSGRPTTWAEGQRRKQLALRGSRGAAARLMEGATRHGKTLRATGKPLRGRVPSTTPRTPTVVPCTGISSLGDDAYSPVSRCFEEGRTLVSLRCTNGRRDSGSAEIALRPEVRGMRTASRFWGCPDCRGDLHLASLLRLVCEPLLQLHQNLYSVGLAPKKERAG